jgi:SAM-dependent methyltransferase
MHLAIDQPSAWVTRFAPLIPLGEVLDLACGSGRHARFLAGLGHRVLAVDRDPEALRQADVENVQTVQLDLESGDDRAISALIQLDRFNGIVITNYLHRPLMPKIVGSLAAGGILIYETFAHGNARFGKPSNPDFLLAPGELLKLTGIQGGSPLRVVAFEEGYVERPKPAIVQRICIFKNTVDIDPTILHLD